MAPFYIILGSFLLLSLYHLLIRRISLSAKMRFSLGVMFAFTGVSHFFLTEQMAAMIPAFLPMREYAVLASGGGEILLSLFLLHGCCLRATTGVTILLLLVLLPFNIYSILEDSGMSGGRNDHYLLIRIGVQLFLVAWTWCMYHTSKSRMEVAQ